MPTCVSKGSNRYAAPAGSDPPRRGASGSTRPLTALEPRDRERTGRDASSDEAGPGRPGLIDRIARSGAYIASMTSYTVTEPPPSRIGEPFAMSVAVSSEAEETIV